jgi:hypothetical protein
MLRRFRPAGQRHQDDADGASMRLGRTSDCHLGRELELRTDRSSLYGEGPASKRRSPGNRGEGSSTRDVALEALSKVVAQRVDRRRQRQAVGAHQVQRRQLAGKAFHSGD